MTEQKQRPLDEVLFGPSDPRPAVSGKDLAGLISAWYRAALARAARAAHTRKSGGTGAITRQQRREP